MFYIKMKANPKPTNVIKSSSACLGKWSQQAGHREPHFPWATPDAGKSLFHLWKAHLHAADRNR